jgi:hypothetical protein
MTIKTKALNLSETLKRKQLESENDSVSVMEETFSARSGWFDRFKSDRAFIVFVYKVRLQVPMKKQQLVNSQLIDLKNPWQ